jgi:branched-chain amino acid transport system ATP-binding protein
LSILIVDKSLKELRQVADTAVILDKGISIWADRLENLPTDLAHKHLGI